MVTCDRASRVCFPPKTLSYNIYFISLYAQSMNSKSCALQKQAEPYKLTKFRAHSISEGHAKNHTNLGHTLSGTLILTPFLDSTREGYRECLILSINKDLCQEFQLHLRTSPSLGDALICRFILQGLRRDHSLNSDLYYQAERIPEPYLSPVLPTQIAQRRAFKESKPYFLSPKPHAKTRGCNSRPQTSVSKVSTPDTRTAGSVRPKTL